MAKDSKRTRFVRKWKKRWAHPGSARCSWRYHPKSPRLTLLSLAHVLVPLCVCVFHIRSCDPASQLSRANIQVAPEHVRTLEVSHRHHNFNKAHNCLFVHAQEKQPGVQQKKHSMNHTHTHTDTHTHTHTTHTHRHRHRHTHTHSLTIAPSTTFCLAIQGHKTEVFRCLWNPKYSLLASCSSDGTARIWPLDVSHMPPFFSHAKLQHKTKRNSLQNDTFFSKPRRLTTLLRFFFLF